MVYGRMHLHGRHMRCLPCQIMAMHSALPSTLPFCCSLVGLPSPSPTETLGVWQFSLSASHVECYCLSQCQPCTHTNHQLPQNRGHTPVSGVKFMLGAVVTDQAEIVTRLRILLTSILPVFIGCHSVSSLSNWQCSECV